MRKFAVYIIVSFVVAGLVLTQSPINAQKEASEASFQRWEYKAVGIQDIRDRSESLEDTERQLNEQYGAQGWELCGANTALWIFKRPRK